MSLTAQRSLSLYTIGATQNQQQPLVRTCYARHGRKQQPTTRITPHGPPRRPGSHNISPKHGLSTSRVTCRTASLEPTPTHVPTDGQKTQRTYDWHKQWWPVAVLGDLELQPRHNLELLGRRLHLWKDLSGSWRCFQDRCPHRGAPLSEGHITPDGCLECPAHAWQFNPDGSCAKIFQIKNPEEHQAAVSSSRSCAITHPVMEADGLLWVWGKGGASAASEAATKSPNLLRHADPRTGELAAEGTIWYSRDIPLQWDTMVEGALDPSRFQAQRKMAIEVREKDMGGREGFACEFSTPIGPYVGEFLPPGMVRYDYGPNFQAVIFVTPTGPGQCRWLMASWSDGEPPSEFIRKYRAMEADPLQNHMQLRNKTLDYDLAILAAMEANAAVQEPGQQYYQPASADLLPAAFRCWLQDVGGLPAAIRTAEATRKLQLPHEHLLDRHQQHVKSCSICFKALEAVQKSLALVNALLPAAALLAAASYFLHPLLPLPLAAATAALAYWRQCLLRHRAQFYYNPLARSP